MSLWIYQFGFEKPLKIKLIEFQIESLDKFATRNIEK